MGSMDPSETLTATVVGAPSGDVPLREGEQVLILGVDQDPAQRLLVRVAGTDGQEAMVRPTLLTVSRTPERLTLHKLEDVNLMIRELDFWRRFWQAANPRKAIAMERMAGKVSRASEERGTSEPLTVLQNARATYRKKLRMSFEH
jgi:hypothetical protein